MAMDKNAYGNWIWAGRYVAVMALALVLAAALGHMQLFEKTTIGGKLTAAHLVEFLGFGGALVALWLLGQRATIVIQKQGGKVSAVQHLILPAVSLLVVALAYSVVALLLKPFLGATAFSIFNWIFIAAIVACAVWLVLAVFDKADPLTALLTQKNNKGK